MIVAMHGDEQTCRWLIDAGAKVNSQTDSGATALLGAVIFNHPAICALLMNAGADANSGGDTNLNPLMRAINNDQEALYKILIRKGNPINDAALVAATEKGNESLCMLLIKHGANMRHDTLRRLIDSAYNKLQRREQPVEDYEKIKALIAQGADCNLRSKNGTTVLMIAASLNDEVTCKMLIDAGADVNAQDIDGNTALWWIARWGSAKICKLLIAHKADVNVCTKYSDTPLRLAAGCKNIEVLKLLINAGADVNAQDSNGNTALHLAAGYHKNHNKFHGNPEYEMKRELTCRLLCEAGANPNIKNKAHSQTPLIIATRQGLFPICKLLIKHGADVNIRRLHDAPLHFAAADGNIELCKLFINSNADLNFQNEHGHTALAEAALFGHELIGELLIEAGADIHIQDVNGNTALMLAANYNLESMCSTLLNAGANIYTKAKNNATALDVVVIRESKQICKMLITDSQVNPVISPKELPVAYNRVLTAFCVFKRLCANLPKDVRIWILMIDPALRQDFCSIAAPIHKNKHLLTPYMPIPTICTLLQKGLLNPQATVAALKDHKCKTLIPLMEETRMQAMKSCTESFEVANKTVPDELKPIAKRVFAAIFLGDPITAEFRAEIEKNAEVLLPLIKESIETKKILLMHTYLNPADLETKFGAGIEQNIKRRLGLPETDADTKLALQSNENGSGHFRKK